MDRGLSRQVLPSVQSRQSRPHEFDRWFLHPSHINAEVPGSIHEGGGLGYALAVAFGAVMDKPELIVPVVIGDGEAETGPQPRE